MQIPAVVEVKMPRGRKTPARGASNAPRGATSRTLRQSTTIQRTAAPPDTSTPPPRKRQRNNPSGSSTNHQSTSTSSGRPLTDQDVPSIVKAVLDALPGQSTSRTSDRDDLGHTSNSQDNVPRKLQHQCISSSDIISRSRYS